MPDMNQQLTSDPTDPDTWRQIVAQMGEAVAGPLTLALERVLALARTGEIDRKSLRCLREELEAARHAGMVCQQIVRFRSGRIRQAAERVHLTQAVQNVLAHRRRETEARGIQVRQVLRPVEVIADGALLFSLLNALLDWALRHARSHIALRLELTSWPVHARLNCQFRRAWPDEVAPPDFADTEPPGGDEVLDDLDWRLIEHAAAAMGLVLARQADGRGGIVVTLEFPRTVSPDLPALADAEPEATGFSASHANSQPLAGSHVLVVASRRDVRVQVREALRPMGLVVDYVSSIEDAIAFCQEGLPHAIIFESLLRGERFNRLREDVLRDVPDFVFIEIVEEGSMFEVSGFGGPSIARVGRAAILASLPSALMFELSRSL
jgi:hypothetical protein